MRTLAGIWSKESLREVSPGIYHVSLERPRPFAVLPADEGPGEQRTGVPVQGNEPSGASGFDKPGRFAQYSARPRRLGGMRGGETTAHRLDFYQLSRSVQERFVGTTQGLGVPALLIRSTSRPAPPWWWIALALAAGMVLGLVVLKGYGIPGSPWALQGPVLIGVYAAAFAAFFFALFRILATSHERASLPYAPAVYLYPVGVIDARSSRPIVHPLTELADASVKGASLSLRFRSGGSFSLEAEKPERAEELRSAIERFRAEVERASHDPRELAALDPLTDSGIPNPLLPKTPLARSTPLWARLMIPLALVLGSILGVTAWVTRNTLSGQKMFLRARTEDTVEAYRAYLASGGTQKSISEVLLPRAELARAKAEGTVQAIEDFARKHPSTAIAGEVTLALREALLAELDRRKRRGRVSLLRELRTLHPNHDLIQAELDQAIHDAYRSALKNFLAHAQPENRELEPFMRRLISHAEKHGPKVLVRVNRREAEPLEDADARIKGSPYFTPESKPSRYLGAEQDRPREERMVQRIIARLQAEFSPEILSFHRGDPVPGEDGPLPDVDTPTILLASRTRVVGAAALNNPRGVYVGLNIAFRAWFQLPKSSNLLEFKYNTWTPPDTETVEQERIGHAELYDRMISKVYARFADRFLGTLLAKP